MALGASPADVLRMVFAYASARLSPDARFPAPRAPARLLAAELFGVSPNDPLTYAAVATALLLAGSRHARFRPCVPCVSSHWSPSALNKGVAPASALLLTSSRIDRSP
jgi:hypothetical protein